jgi:23S rRNA G2445 N2-methylase RlmL
MSYTHDLIEALALSDERTRRHVGDQLLAMGDQAIPQLVRALRHSDPRVRQSAAFLLGRLGERVPPAALAHALADDDPKVRKNAAVALGRLAAPDTAPALSEALGREAISWVRSSLVLALGAVGGDQVHALLAGIEAASDEEREALRKALDRTSPTRPPAQWVAGGWRPPVVLECPPGLEQVALDELREAGLPRAHITGEGWLELPRELAPDTLKARLRCAYGPLLEAGSGPALNLHSPEQAAAQVAALVAASQTLRRWREWVAPADGELRIRIALGPHARAEVVRAIFEAVRGAARPLGIADSPSRYDAELVIELRQRRTMLFVRPSFMGEPRFGYRHADVPAAIDPVVAAGIARIGRTRPGAVVFDPTCGSSTLLIERAQLGGAAQLFGLDIEPRALDASHANIAAAGLSTSITITQGDAENPRHWPACDEVLANLPFGLRTERVEPDIIGLYRALARNLGDALRPGGRAVLYTTRTEWLEDALNEVDELVPDGRFEIFTGGLWVTAIVAARR